MIFLKIDRIRTALFPVLFLGLAAAGCDSSNPVAPEAPDAGASATYSITMAANPGKLTAGSAEASQVTITVRRRDTGAAPAEGTVMTLNTNLGNFGVDSTGKPVQLVTPTLFGGQAQVSFFAGDDAGTATILAELTDSTGSLNLVIEAAGTPPTAKFTVQTDGLQAIFTDASTGDPVSWSWDFGDGGGSGQRNPVHTYARAGSYVATLTVTNASGQSDTVSNFVSVTTPGNPLKAKFTVSTSGLEAIFTDASEGSPTAWAWDFGDGSTSSAQNPTHAYAAPGTYTVTLTISNDVGQSATGVQFVTVQAPGGTLEASFTVSKSGLEVLFTDTSKGSPVSWAWDFGDGSSSSAQSPVHTYAASGTYTVSLTVTNSIGESDSASQLVSVAPEGTKPDASFTTSIDDLRVIFTDTSKNSPTAWAWDFGDGSSSSEQNPVHTYATAGTYTVTLSASNDAGSDTASAFVTVPPASAPSAGFTFEADKLKVSFTDTSTGDPTAWAWDFGDGGTSTQQNPIHSYAASGTYTVTLKVTNDAGESTISKFVSVDDGLEADFTVSVDDLKATFTNTSEGNPTSFAWDFGDGGSSSVASPTHTYAAAGTYTVTLTISNGSGSSTTQKSVTVSDDCRVSPCG